MNTPILRQQNITPSIRRLSHTSSHLTGISLKRASALLTLWLNRQRQRRQLSQLSTRQLRDMGIEIAERDNEVRKMFWEK